MIKYRIRKIYKINIHSLYSIREIKKKILINGKNK